MKPRSFQAADVKARQTLSIPTYVSLPQTKRACGTWAHKHSYHLGPSLQVDAVAFGAFLPLAWDSFWVVLTDNL